MEEHKSYWEFRQEYLSPPLSSRELRLSEIREAAARLSGDPNDLRLFGMSTGTWYSLGVRIQGRTVVEVTRDPQARFFARSVAGTLRQQGRHVRNVIDPFVGSGNVLYHFMNASNAMHGVGIEANPEIGRLTTRNFAVMHRRMRPCAEIDIIVGDWTRYRTFLNDQPTLVLVMPPWGEGFTKDGLDLRRTEPPISHILGDLEQSDGTGSVLAAILTFPDIVLESLDEIRARYRTFVSAKPAVRQIAERVDYLLVQLR